MIKTIWSSLSAYLIGTNTPVGRLLIANDAAEVGILPLQIDLGDVQNLGDVASVEIEILTNGTAPAANQSITAWAAFTSSGSKTPPELTPSALSVQCALAQVANVRRIYMMPLASMTARYLNIWFDHTALPNGATLEIVVHVNGKTS